MRKMVSGSGKDYLDVQSVSDIQQRKPDYQYIFNWLTQFADFLESPEMLLDYQAMVIKSARVKDI
jgi:hypothetical protein